MISGSRPWPFRVTWRHRSCDHLILELFYSTALYTIHHSFTLSIKAQIFSPCLNVHHGTNSHGFFSFSVYCLFWPHATLASRQFLVNIIISHRIISYYHITSYHIILSYHIVSYHIIISHRIISHYHITSYHIISDHIRCWCRRRQLNSNINVFVRINIQLFALARLPNTTVQIIEGTDGRTFKIK